MNAATLALVQQLMTPSAYLARTNVPYASAVGNPYAGSFLGKNLAETKLYGGLGSNASNVRQTDWWEYDIALNTWTSKAAGTGLADGGTASLGGYIYVHGGFDAGGTTTGQLNRYDPATNTWSGMTGGSQRAHFTLAPITSGKLIAACGYTSAVGGGQKRVDVYDVALNTWTQKADHAANTAMVYVHGGAVGDGDTYVHAAYQHNGSPNGASYKYSLTGNAWTYTGPTSSTFNPAAGSGESLDGSVYTMGDTGAGTFYQEFNPIWGTTAGGITTQVWLASSGHGAFGAGKLGNNIAVAQGSLWTHMRDLNFGRFTPHGLRPNRARRLAALVAVS